MNTQQPPTTSSSDGADPIRLRVHWATVGLSLTIPQALVKHRDTRDADEPPNP